MWSGGLVVSELVLVVWQPEFEACSGLCVLPTLVLDKKAVGAPALVPGAPHRSRHLQYLQEMSYDIF